MQASSSAMIAQPKSYSWRDCADLHRQQHHCRRLGTCGQGEHLASINRRPKSALLRHSLTAKLIPASASAPTVPERQWLRIVDVVSNPETQPNRLDQADRLNLGEARGETDDRSLMIEREAASARSAVRVAMSKISQVPNIAQLISPREFSNAMLGRRC
jgi:hypothetical protein